MSIISKPANFLREVKQELLKVSWPTRQELVGSTFVVIGVTGILALYIGLIDLFLSHMLNILFK
ncbi:MAG: preprotein translocase subunit SecE [Candidatus Omnitrophota bacterium]|nr:MAG: preprotein translocase subunit SecE [Candidatus Omnitrophota bacterium]